MTKLLAPWSETKWLVLSSCLFIAPSVLSFCKKLYLLSMMGFLTTIISINYWRKCSKGLRRNIDLFFSKLMFIVKTYHFMLYATKWSHYKYYISICLLVSIIYYIANQKIKYWYLFHVLFHTLVVYCGIKILLIIN
uniref:Uncharacterized protein n=1 Tax=Florenciella sp. virus SA2 TaxID=3240092 RepID=A0AB39J8Z3_9VIRU